MTEALNLLNPRALDMRNPGGGRPELTAQDVAAALAGLKHEPYYLGMLVYAEDAKSFYSLFGLVAGLKQIPKKPQALKGAVPVRGVLLLCLDELWGDNKCGTCNGAGVNQDQQECPVCKGRGWKAYTDLSRARQAGIPWQYWPKYKGFYERLYIQLTDWNAQVWSHLKRKLSDEQLDSLPALRGRSRDENPFDQNREKRGY